MSQAGGRTRAASRSRALTLIYLAILIALFTAGITVAGRAAGAGDIIWTWNQTDLSEFTGNTNSFTVKPVNANLAICAGHIPSNHYIGATAPAWLREQDYTYSGVARFAGLGSRAGVALYYQDIDNLYQVNIQSGDTDPAQSSFRLRRFNNGAETQLIEDNTIVFAFDTWYEFRLTIETHLDHVHFHLELDDETGVRLLQYDDFSPDRFTAGRVGLRKKQGPEACWDDLTVVALDGLPPMATRTPTPGPGTPSATPIAPTPTNTSSGGGRTSPTPILTQTPSLTPTPSNTPTPDTPSATPITPTATATSGGGGGRMTSTPSQSLTPSPTLAASNTPGSGTPTATPLTSTATATLGGGRISPTPSLTPTASNTPGPGTPSATPAPTNTPGGRSSFFPSALKGLVVVLY